MRFTDQVGDRTLVKLMTDGILLAEIQRDRLLRRYDTLIIDEAHERSLNIDFLLGYLTSLLPRRPDLKLIVTSATIDTERFAAPLRCPGRRGVGPHLPGRGPLPARRVATSEAADQVDGDRGIARSTSCGREGPGDVLVFLSRRAGDPRHRRGAAATPDLPGTEILPLYARLSAAEQHRVFRPHQGRRIVLATNVAETSLTVPGIRYVVDPGTARISRYSRRTKVQRLPIEAISQASANQRAGRCGRVAPGICIRLYSEDDFDARPEFTEPEILRTNLASVILQMAALGLGDVAAFPFVDPPDARAIRDGVALLEELGALRGRTARLDPARAAAWPACRSTPASAAWSSRPTPTAACARCWSSRPPCRSRTRGSARPARRPRPTSCTPASPTPTRTSWPCSTSGATCETRAAGAVRRNQFRRLCRAEYLNYCGCGSGRTSCASSARSPAELGVRRNRQPADADAIHRSLLAGLLSHIGMYDRTTREHVGARQARFPSAPGSALPRRRRPGSWPPSWSRPTGCGPAWSPASNPSGPSSWPATW